MTDRFQGKVIAITGAGGALGGACAMALAREGAQLLLMDRDPEALAAVAADCPGAVTLGLDVTSAADFDRAAALAAGRFGAVDALVAAAGIIGPALPAIEVDEADWDRLFAINVKGTWLAARTFIPLIRARGRGAVVLFSSTAGLTGSRFLPAYSASKGAVTQLTRSLALAHAAENIRVNCVCPGTIESPMAEQNLAASPQGPERDLRRVALEATHPMGRFGLPQEVAGAVLYLLSDAASYTTGVALPVDGGRLA